PLSGDPWSEPGGRLYRTGDLARYLADGVLEFLGRVDHQIKLRGIRIEPGEIEATLEAHPQVRKAVALVRQEQPGEGHLVAYLVPANEHPPSRNELRRALRERLPESMMPSVLVVVEDLPLLPNGKVDRNALGRRELPAAERSAEEEELVAPGTPTEELLAGIWAEVLGLGRVGVRDSFFDIGGHSLLAMQVVSRIRQTFQVELPLQRIFETPTIAELARSIEDAGRQEQGLKVPAIVPVSRDGVDGLPLSFAQQRLWFLEQLETGNTAYNIPGAVRLSGAVDAGVLERVLTEVVRRHEALRTTFAARDGRPVQVIAKAFERPLPVVDLRRPATNGREAEAWRLIRREELSPFDLTAGPLIRFALLRLADERHVALVTMHHIVSDAWSLGVFIRELAVLYEAFSQGMPSPLPELGVQYADFAHWQREVLAGEVLENELAHWRATLAGAPRSLELPTDHRRPTVQSFRGASRPVMLPAELTNALAALSRRQGVTLFMTLLATFQALLSRYSGQHDVVVGSPIAGRHRRELEPLIGFFVNTLVLRTDLSGDPDFRELLARVRRGALDAYAHQNLPFEQLVEELDPERDLSRNPIFQVMFMLQNVPRSELKLPGVRLSPLERQAVTAKFDLTLTLLENEAGITGALEYNTDLFD
ncbi:MAG: non-ribosomal peptide synthetase, partial [bacterium]|nr:non-ribosomal peptide synthetase [bacterium]